MAGFVVSTLFRARDRISAAFRGMGRNSDRFSRRATRAFNRVNRRASIFRSTLKSILVSQVIGRGFQLLTAGIRGVTDEFIQFDDAITAAAAKLDGGAIKRGTAAFDELGAAARKVGAETEFTAAVAAKGLDFLAFAGFSAVDAMKALPKVTDLATATQTDLATAVDIATDTLGAFFPNADTTEKKMKALERVTNVLGIATTSSNMDLVTMFETIKDVAPNMRVAGQEIEQFSTLTAFMANAGIKGTKSATALKNVIKNLANPTKQTRITLRKLGIQVGKKGNFLKLSSIIDQVRKKMSKMGNVQKLATTAVLFGARAMAGSSVLIAKSNKTMGDFEQTLNSTGRTTHDIAEEMRKSLGNRLKALQSAFIELGFKIIEEFTGPVDKGVIGLTKRMREFDVKPIVDTLKSLFRIVGQVFNFIKDNKETLKSVAKAFVILKIAVLAVKGAMWLLNIAMLANPVGAIIILVFGLVTALGIMLFDLKEAGFTWEEIWKNMELVLVKSTNFMRQHFTRIVNGMIKEINDFNSKLGIFGIAKKQEGVTSAPEGPLIPEVVSPELVVGLARQKRIEDRLKVLREQRGLGQRKKAGIEGAMSPSLLGQGAGGQVPDDITAAIAQKDRLTAGLTDNLKAQLKAGLLGSSRESRERDNWESKQKTELTGTLTIAGAPKGSTFEGTIGGVPLTSNLGVN